MKNSNSKTSFILIALLSICGIINAQKSKANKDTEAWRYEIEAVGVGVQGTYVIKVWSYSKKPEVAIEQAKKNAVHGVIFKGYSGKSQIPGQKAIAPNLNIEQEKEDFFKPFFADGGKYMKYVSLSDDGSVAAEDRLKIGKEYKIGVIVSININALRQDLESAGLIKGLSDGF